MSNPEAVEVLNRVFKLESFRPMQAEVVDHILAGQSGLVVMPTGMGKSLCFQLPALMLPGLTVVISPLIALMKDQVDAVRKLGIEAQFINSSLNKHLREQRYRELSQGKIKMLYVTPERFRKLEFLEALRKNKISLMAVDEAHCISEWGHDFRPDYSRLKEMREEMGEPPVIALTATATQEVQSDILTQLGLSEGTRRFVTGVERENLKLHVEDVYGIDDKVRNIFGRAMQIPGPKIVYFSLISTLQNVERELEKLNMPPLVYHGQLPDKIRRRNQEQFLASDDGLILATPAFGLGVNKPNVRAVIHGEVPGSIEAYYQEVGRAGRDGLPAECFLLFDPDDISIQMDFIKWSKPDPGFIRNVYQLLERNLDRFRMEGLDYIRHELNFYNSRDFRTETAMNLLERWGAISWRHKNPKTLEVVDEIPEEFLNEQKHKVSMQKQNQKLYELVELLKTEGCRKQLIYAYFGVTLNDPCGTCDNCERVS